MSMATKQKQESGFAETVRVIFHALLIALVIRTFLFQPFNIPSGSMKNTPTIGLTQLSSKMVSCSGTPGNWRESQPSWLMGAGT
jgi:hypothetical protein